MKIVGVIPARYQSTRFPGKPLADICGKPMIYWVYYNIKKSKKLDDVLVATDDLRIANVCQDYNIKYVMTADNHANHIERIWEVSNLIEADYYICVNGDEPLIDYKLVEKILPSQAGEVEYFKGAFRKLTDPVETIDSANIKVVLNKENRCIYLSRSTVPFPKGTLMFNYFKYVGIECFTKLGLDFFKNTDIGIIESIEDIDHLRFIENGKPIYFTEIESNSISVDTKKDLEKVRFIMAEKQKNKI